MAQEGKRISKKWGNEVVLTNTEHYCAKNLLVDPGRICSLHRHVKKHETFIVQEGEGVIEVAGQAFEVVPMAFVHIAAGTWHRFWSSKGMKLLEVSTHHDDDDVERDGESGNLKFAPLMEIDDA